MAERPVVWISHRTGDRCAGCAAEVFTGDFVQITRETGIRCVQCAGLADLAYLVGSEYSVEPVPGLRAGMRQDNIGP